MLELVDSIVGGAQTAWARLSGAAPQRPPGSLSGEGLSYAEELAVGRDPAPVIRPWQGPMGDIPRNRAEVYDIYGDPGRKSPSRAFQRRRLTIATGLPGRWNGGRGRLYIHRLVEPYLREALRRAQLDGSLEEITRLGCYSFRHQRHDATRPLSYHSWAIAVDINPRQNRARGFPPGKAPRPWSAKWFELWPAGISEGLVSAFESTGWSWGGRWRTFKDPMHFELVA